VSVPQSRAARRAVTAQRILEAARAEFGEHGLEAGIGGRYPSWSRRRVRAAVSAVLPASSMAWPYAARDS
jgi:hypothetical protein